MGLGRHKVSVGLGASWAGDQVGASASSRASSPLMVLVWLNSVVATTVFSRHC